MACALLTCLGAGGTAHAASPGLNVAAYGDARAAVQQGAKQVRFCVPWKNFEPAAARDFNANGPATPTPLVSGLKAAVDEIRREAIPIMVVLDAPDWAGAGGPEHKRPADARARAAYAEFVGELAAWIGNEGNPPVYEVWNEPDAPKFWGGGAPDAAGYTEMLRSSHAAIKAVNPAATVLTGPTTGNNYAWIEALYANGAKGAFDGVSVHTDTACSIVGPDVFYRDPNGRIGQFAFLGYREVRASMLANGDPKPIWMTEIGWGTTTAVCSTGESAGRKAEGVSEAEQAAFLTKGYQCMANDPYVVAAAWFTLRDAPANPYGLYREDGSAKPSLAAFRGAAEQGPGECGDFTPPAINVISPVEGQQFVDKLDLQASASDTGTGLARLTFAFDGGKEIRNFSGLLNDSPVGLAPWQGSGTLALGPHTIEVTALDRNGNAQTRVVRVTKVAPGAIKATLQPAFRLGRRVSCKRRRSVRTCTLKGLLSRGAIGRPAISGRVAVEWQRRNKQGRYRRVAGGLKRADRAFTFTRRIRSPGRWRARVVFKGAGAYKPATSKWVTFRVR